MKTLTTIALLVISIGTSIAQNATCASLSFDAEKEIIVQDGIAFTGVCENFHSTGELEETRSFENGVLHGPNKKYHKNGTVLKEGSYNKGIVDGVWKTYDSQGKLLSEKTFNNGEAVK